MEQKPNALSGGEQKTAEYVARIRGGESKEEILKGLSPTFAAGIEAGLQETDAAAEDSIQSTEGVADIVPPQYRGMTTEAVDIVWSVPRYVDEEKTRVEQARKQRALDALRLQESEQAQLAGVRERLGISDAPQEQADSSRESNPDALFTLVSSISKGRKQDVIDLYKNLYPRRNEPETRRILMNALFIDIYNNYRLAPEYPIDPDEERVWNTYLKSTNIDVDNKKTEWMYRGVFPRGDEETVARGSFNVHVTPGLIDALDEMITSGKIRANYKFGQPGTTASPNERHDAISIYFLQQPSDESLRELSAIVLPYVRGNTLLGKKISEGFYMSEIGSVESSHIDTLVAQLQPIDAALARAIKNYTSPALGKKDISLKMSEAQFYAIRDTARAFGLEISYDKTTGFAVAPGAVVSKSRSN